MILSVSRLALVAVVAALAACASVKTPAQTLAWERWQTCKADNLALVRITPEGQITVTYHADQDSVAALSAWHTCERGLAVEQLAR